MLIVTAKLTKKKLALIFTAILLLLSGLLVFVFSPGTNAPQQSDTSFSHLSTNDARLALLASRGLEALPEPVATLNLQLPSPLDERYAAYNQLQLPQGFDLTAYCGKNLTRYTYTVTNYPNAQDTQANLYLYEDTLVAADLFSAGENGFIAPLFSE